MPGYFLDTWFFIAYLNEADAHHRAVVRLAQTLGGVAFFTHDGVLMELLTFFSAHGSFWRGQVAAFVRDTLISRQFHVANLSRQLFEGALTLYEQRPDKEYSLTDCASMVLMRERGLTHVLTNDHHFEQEGFTIVSA